MTSPNKLTSKPSMVAKMSVKPIWRKKPNLCNTSNVLNTTSPIPKSLTPHHETSQENNHPNQALPNPYIKNTPTSPQVCIHLYCNRGADFLGPLLPDVAEICSGFDPTVDVEPSLLKLFHNLWFYVALFGLAPPVLNHSSPTNPNATPSNTAGSTTAVSLQAVNEPYMWNPQWCSAVKHICQGTSPLNSGE
ncbi:hypothetical protein Tco_1272928 [Tanacetum coccineum]